MLAPCLVEPGNALVEALGLGNQRADLGREQGELVCIRTPVGRESTVEAHLAFGDFS